eukprot:4077702-Alexandrium_andersonii.AAC.1
MILTPAVSDPPGSSCASTLGRGLRSSARLRAFPWVIVQSAPTSSSLSPELRSPLVGSACGGWSLHPGLVPSVWVGSPVEHRRFGPHRGEVLAPVSYTHLTLPTICSV